MEICKYILLFNILVKINNNILNIYIIILLTMREIKFENLEFQKKYYIETNKGKFRHSGYFNGFIRDTEIPENHENPETPGNLENQGNIYAIFMNIQRIRTNKNSLYVKCFIANRNKIYWKYYLPEKDTIIKNFEKNTLHLILRSITGDPSFFYY